jgi:pimeloyl-ACP methyl ester carboxylesterase
VRPALGAIALLVGCADAAGGDSGPGADPWVPPGGGEVELLTEDGVVLVADYYPAATAGAPAFVLLHMIPPAWDRTSWPGAFVAALQDSGASVLVPDRRGAGESGGEAQDAYEGEAGKYDVAAAVDRLVADGAGPVAVIGASNGTTSALDHAVWAQAGHSTVPAALGFMTGGTYTENQTDMASLGDVPAVFTYSTEERGWSVAQQDLDPGTWSFLEYAAGDHGTRMFDAAPEVQDDLLAFFAGALGG